MKKIVVCVMLMTACLFTACGSNEKVITGEVSNMNAGTESTESVAGGKEESVENGYAFVAQNTSVVIDAEAQAILEKLEEPASVYESPSCAFGDLDKIYTYNGFEVDTYTMEGVEYISTVVLRDDSVTTPEGMGIGNTVEEVKAVYGEPDEEENTILVYAKDQMKLCFLLQDNTVVSVEYRNTILE